MTAPLSEKLNQILDNLQNDTIGLADDIEGLNQVQEKALQAILEAIKGIVPPYQPTNYGDGERAGFNQCRQEILGRIK